MLLTIFTIFMSFALVLLFIGYYTRHPEIQILSFFIMLILGVTTSGIFYEDNGFEYHNGDTITENGATTTVTPIYATYESKYIGYFLGALGGLGIVLVLLNTGGRF